MWEVGNQKRRDTYPEINQYLLDREGYIEETEAKVLFVKFLKENPSFAVKLLTGIRLFPFQHMAVKAMMQTDYFLGIWSRGLSKSFTTGIFAILDAILNQGVHIGIISKTFRQSKMIFNKIEEISKSPKATFLAQAITKVSKNNDGWTMEIGRSRITALPLGDGEKLRGFRFQRMIIDELLLMPEKILNEVILPFLAVIENPTEREDIYVLESEMIATGQMTEDERKTWPNNKIIGLSSASYKFEHLYKMYQQYEALIRNPELAVEDDPTNPQQNTNSQAGDAHRVIMHFAYDMAPSQLYDKSLLQQAKATLSESQFAREFGARFTDDSSGYFKVSKMKACTIPDGEGPSVELIGQAKDEYILAIDPSWSESEGSDDFAMEVTKLLPNGRKSIVVHAYARSGAALKDHMRYALYIIQNFNIKAIVADYNGGVQFVKSCNESKLFKDANIELGVIDADLDKHLEYEKGIKDLKRQYNSETHNYVFLRKPTSQWIRVANELLQAAFDHKKLLFAGAAMDDDYHFQRSAKIPISEIEFLSIPEKNSPDGAKMIDFVEHQSEMMSLIKVQCALVEVTTSAQGNQNFDLPMNLKKQRGAFKARKDSYSALVLANWMSNVYYDIQNYNDDDHDNTFTPIFIA
tara:strand:+ start:574 stop:2481 length:1908 start_codon:yes stop_codon:yes gene_type:complete